jgi:MFS superfamily sulfate permease-like transporter
MIMTGVAVRFLALEAAGVKTIGAVPAGLPAIKIPSFSPALFPELCAEAAGIALIGFSSMMLTARSFAAKNRYEIDVDQEFAALGAANIAAALSQGFAISGADSRTAVSDAAGGRTRVTGLVTAAAVAFVLVFLTGPLQYVPSAALGAVLVGAAFSLLDLKALGYFYRVDRRELALSVVATLGVASVGAFRARKWRSSEEYLDCLACTTSTGIKTLSRFLACFYCVSMLRSSSSTHPSSGAASSKLLMPLQHSRNGWLWT